MISFSLTFLSVAFLAISQLSGVASAPWSKEVRTVQPRAAPSAPHWVIYSDEWETRPPAASTLSGFNRFILGFYIDSGATDNVVGWTQLSATERASIKAEYAAAGISLMISAFGSTEQPTTNGVDPVAFANTLADFVIQYGLDGIDIDYEDFTAWNQQDGRSETWLISLTKQLRTKLPVGQYIISHAPIGAWFPSNLWSGGGYEAIDTAVGDLIDFYNIQFYSQNADQYVTCAGLLDHSTQFPGSALFEISAAGVPLSKLVIGKPATTADASDYMPASTLATCLQEAKGKGWTGGAMIWEYPDAGSAFITTARSLSWPVGGGTPPTSSSSTSTTSMTSSSTTTSSTSTPTGGSCGSVPAWTSTAVFTGGESASYNGDLWTAKWWTQGDIPGQPIDAGHDVWVDNGPCS